MQPRVPIFDSPQLNDVGDASPLAVVANVAFVVVVVTVIVVTVVVVTVVVVNVVAVVVRVAFDTHVHRSSRGAEIKLSLQNQTIGESVCVCERERDVERALLIAAFDSINIRLSIHEQYAFTAHRLV